MKRVGVREFRDRATRYFKETEPIAVERHGRLIGFYIPVESKKKDEAELKEALARLDASVKRVLEETGMTEDELADYFGLSKQPPELPRERASGRG
jgi:PHD/YefM family antitoxin component YafN of YafNO toxin-antitoxin module